MSKMNGLRAMREARYERSLTQAPLRGGQAPARPRTRPTPAVEEPEGAAPAAEPADALCGHRAISGRTCTREQGHEARSHRYS